MQPLTGLCWIVGPPVATDMQALTGFIGRILSELSPDMAFPNRTGRNILFNMLVFFVTRRGGWVFGLRPIRFGGLHPTLRSNSLRWYGAVGAGFKFQVSSGFRFQVSSGFSSSTLET